MADSSVWVLVAFVIFVALLYKPGKKTVLAFLDSTIDIHEASIREAASFSKENINLLAIAQAKRNGADEDTKKIITHAKNESKRIEKLLGEQRKTLMHHAQNLVQKRYELGLKEIENHLYRNIILDAFNKITNTQK